MWIVWCYLLRRDLIWLSGEHMRCGFSGSCRCSGGTPRLTVLEQYTHGIARSSGGGRAPKPPSRRTAYRLVHVPQATKNTKTWRKLGELRRKLDEYLRRVERFDARGRARSAAATPHPGHAPGAVSTTRPGSPIPGAAGPGRPGTLPLAARDGAPTPHPDPTHPRHASHDRRHSSLGPVTCSHPPTRPPTARPRATRVPVRRRPHPRPHRDTRSPDLRPTSHTATPVGIGCDPSPPPPSPAARSRRPAPARRAGGAGRVRVSRSRADCAPPAPRPWLRRGPRRVLRRLRAAGGPISVGISETTAHSERSTGPHNRYRDGAPPPGFFWLFAIRELVSNKPCVILAASWWMSGDGQCRDETR